MSKYDLLWKYLEEHRQDIYQLSFGKIKDTVGDDIDDSFLNYKREVKKYGYEVENISLKEKKVIFKKIS